MLNFSASHQYLDDNPSGTPADQYTVQTTVVDKDGGSVGLTNNASIVLNSLTGDVGNTDFNFATTQTFAPITANQLSFTTSGYAHSHGGGPVDVFVQVHNTASGQWDEVYRQTIPTAASSISTA